MLTPMHYLSIMIIAVIAVIIVCTFINKNIMKRIAAERIQNEKDISRSFEPRTSFKVKKSRFRNFKSWKSFLGN